MDPTALNYDPEANVPCDDCCEYPTDVTLTFGGQTDNTIDIIMENITSVAGYQFSLDGLDIINA